MPALNTITQPQVVYAFWRRAGPNQVVVVLILSGYAQRETLDFREVTGNYREAFTDRNQTLATKANLELEP